MSNREKAHNYTIRSTQARLRYNESKRIRRLENKKNNKFSDIDTFKAKTLPMSATNQTSQSQNSTGDGVQIKVSYDDTLPFYPQPGDEDLIKGNPDDVRKIGMSVGMQPIIQSASDALSQPIPNGSTISTQAFGRGPNDGRTNKLRALLATESPESPNGPVDSLVGKAKDLLKNLFQAKSSAK